MLGVKHGKLARKFITKAINENNNVVFCYYLTGILILGLRYFVNQQKI